MNTATDRWSRPFIKLAISEKSGVARETITVHDLGACQVEVDELSIYDLNGDFFRTPS